MRPGLAMELLQSVVSESSVHPPYGLADLLRHMIKCEIKNAGGLP